MSFNTIIDMGEIGEQEVTVEFDYQPAERMTRDDPGCSAEVEILAVMFMGVDIKSECSHMINQFEQEAFDYLDGQRDSALADRAEYQRDLREAA